MSVIMAMSKLSQKIKIKDTRPIDHVPIQPDKLINRVITYHQH